MPIEADQGQISQLLVILVENALLAARGVLRISTAVEGDLVHLRVVENGAGVPAELLPRLFQPFVTGRRRDGPGGGNGLGLAIARGIAERHGGAIEAGRSDLGGARFEVVLPRVQPALAAARLAEGT
jgi:signal transduction histidine kinase